MKSWKNFGLKKMASATERIRKLIVIIPTKLQSSTGFRKRYNPNALPLNTNARFPRHLALSVPLVRNGCWTEIVIFPLIVTATVNHLVTISTNIIILIVDLPATTNTSEVEVGKMLGRNGMTNS